MDYSERWMRAEIAAIPDGDEFTEDGWRTTASSTSPFDPRAAHRRGDELVSRLDRHRPAGARADQRHLGVTAGATYNAIFHLTDMGIPKNSGAYRPIRIIVPPGSAVNVVYPGPSVGGNTETHPKLADMVVAALAPAIAGPGGGRGGRDGLQLPLRRGPPGDAATTTRTTTSRAGAGAQVVRRRQRRGERQERQLPEHAGRDLR